MRRKRRDRRREDDYPAYSALMNILAAVLQPKGFTVADPVDAVGYNPVEYCRPHELPLFEFQYTRADDYDENRRERPARFRIVVDQGISHARVEEGPIVSEFFDKLREYIQDKHMKLRYLGRDFSRQHCGILEYEVRPSS